jgi:PAS domain S-box-containing protein
VQSVDDWKLTDRLQAPAGKGDPFAAAVRATRMPMLITDPRQPDNPIVFVNEAFLRLTGYTRGEVMGRNCRFLQGPDTAPEAVGRIRDAVAGREDIAIDLLNYKKDGTPFWNALYISPVTDEANELLFYFASQLDVTERKEAELEVIAERDRIEAAVKRRTRELEAALQSRTELRHEVDHRVKNNLQLISALVMLATRAALGGETLESLRILRERVEALATVHRRLDRHDDSVAFDVAAFVRDYAAGAIERRGQQPLELQLDLDVIKIAVEHAAPVALIASEFVRIAIRHGEGRDSGRPTTLSIKRIAPDVCRLGVEADGDGADLVTLAEATSRDFIALLAGQLGETAPWDGGGQAPSTISVDIPLRAMSHGG